MGLSRLKAAHPARAVQEFQTVLMSFQVIVVVHFATAVLYLFMFRCTKMLSSYFVGAIKALFSLPLSRWSGNIAYLLVHVAFWHKPFSLILFRFRFFLLGCRLYIRLASFSISS
ncbi:hypothetical protein RHGRI_007143 [Rhododendron griersonianum]|uniref:Uncharacterized protein n=1 Tax=Rhododendron griersonianum TaxID=479676 RepID=A0AAV6KVS8_9ERIC|nr:hypothetical protein RHGRI_007143 [Rhododendron griersonianum]